jgi:hypothetical protein
LVTTLGSGMQQASKLDLADAKLIMTRVVTLLAVGWLSVAVIVIPIVGLVSGVGWFIRLGIRRFGRSDDFAVDDGASGRDGPVSE